MIAIACGRAILPEPLVEHAGVAVPLLAAADAIPDGLAAGGIVAVGHPANPGVLAADRAAHLLLPADDGYHLIAAETAALTRLDSFDPFRRLFAIAWTPSAATRVAGRDVLDDALNRGALFAAAELLGVAQRAIDLAVEYAAQRSQFGKPIGSFQAVKHLLASAQVKIEFARPVVLAAAAMAPGKLATTRISHAKLAASVAADAATHAALQVHGAMGFSWEVDVHLLLKRALALGQAWGTPAFHRTRVAAHVTSAALGSDRTFGAPLREDLCSAAA